MVTMYEILEKESERYSTAHMKPHCSIEFTALSHESRGELTQKNQGSHISSKTFKKLHGSIQQQTPSSCPAKSAWSSMPSLYELKNRMPAHRVRV